jgi:hypothetical protein
VSRDEGDSTAVRMGLAEAKVRRAIKPAKAGKRMPNKRMVSKLKEIRHQEKEFKGWSLPSGGSITRSIKWERTLSWMVQDHGRKRREDRVTRKRWPNDLNRSSEYKSKPLSNDATSIV